MSRPRDRKSKCCELTACSLCGAPFLGSGINRTTGSPGLRSHRPALKAAAVVKSPIEATIGSSILPPKLSAEDVVNFERLVDLGEPFSPVGCAAAAALID